MNVCMYKLISLCLFVLFLEYFDFHYPVHPVFYSDLIMPALFEFVLFRMETTKSIIWKQIWVILQFHDMLYEIYEHMQ